jgi:hypothetical protein
MQISPIKNPNFEKPSWNLSNRTKVKILEKKFFLNISQKQFGSAYAQSSRKCSNIKILAKIERKRSKIFKFKIFKIISCLCTFKNISVVRHLPYCPTFSCTL